MAIENVDAWVCVLRDGTEWITDWNPRWNVMNMQWGVNDIGDDIHGIQLPKGIIRKLIGKDLGFMDEPVKLPEKFD